MTEDLEESVKALRTAIEIEENGLNTFLKFARKTKNIAGKNVFIQLAIDENRHRHILMEQLTKLLEGKQWNKVDIPETELEAMVPTLRDTTEKTKSKEELGELDALNAGLLLERKTAKFFRDLAESAVNDEAKALFVRLAEWEDVHYDLIQAELDSLNSSGYWLGIPEFKMDAMY